MKANFEKVPSEASASWTLLNRRLPEAIPFEWHHHPEYELTLTLNSRGHRYIGNHVAPYEDGDLILIGPNIPHSWSSVARLDPDTPHIALVIWFSQAWAESLLGLFPELAAIRPLLAAADSALSFSREACREVRPLIEAMVEQGPSARLVSLLAVLNRLARDTQATPIPSARLTPAGPPLANDPRLRRVLQHLHRHYAEPPNIAQLADMASVSVSAFHRMFRRHARCTALDYIARLRIGHACALLMQGNLAVALIAERVGYGSQALFNRQFKALKGMTPTAFRQQHGHHFQ